VVGRESEWNGYTGQADGGAQQLLWYIISGTAQSSEGCLALVFVSARPVQLIVIIINNILVIISVSQGILVG
jgi:hypothetical protein